MVFHLSLSDSNFTLFSRNLLSILAILNNAVVWMVSTGPPNSKSSRLFNNHLVTVQKAPITIGIIVILMFHFFFNSQARSRYSSFFSDSFSFILWSAGQHSRQFCKFSFFIRSGLLAELITIIIIIIIKNPWRSFTSLLADSLSLESEC